MPAPDMQTKRLLLRNWKKEDLISFQKLNADPRVMEHFPSPLSKEESDALAGKIMRELEKKSYGLWAVETLKDHHFIGFVGLHYQDFPAPFTPCIEIGWRLSFDAWGKGYAFEAAKKVIEYAFETLQLKELVSFTAASNDRSIRLMERLGMTHDPKDDFEHPKIPQGHPLRNHVLYRLKSHSNGKKEE